MAPVEELLLLDRRRGRPTDRRSALAGSWSLTRPMTLGPRPGGSAVARAGTVNPLSQSTREVDKDGLRGGAHEVVHPPLTVGHSQPRDALSATERGVLEFHPVKHS